MLYNPKWEIKTQPSLEGFIAWLETKNPDETYHWPRGTECAVGQYATSIGKIEEFLIRKNECWRRLNRIAMPEEFHDDTFGCCLARAHAAMTAQ